MRQFCVLIAFGLLAAATSLGATALGGRVSDPIAMTRDSLRLPNGCNPREVAMLLSRFTDAVNAGDQASLARLLVTDDPPGRAQEPAGAAFRWYSVTEARSGARQPWRHRALYDRADVLAYFAERREQDERMSLVEVEVRASSLAGAVGLTFKVRREADDLPPWLSPFAGGKAGIDCAEQAIYLWSMGQTDRDSLGQICPRPQGWKPSAPIVACSRGSNASSLAPDFRLGSTSLGLPKPCRPRAVKQRVRAALSAFNVGAGDSFARSFLVSGEFHPYTASFPGVGFVARARIASFVSARYRAGDGWTASRLLPPGGSAGLPKRAVYGLEFQISYQGVLVTKRASAKLVVNCRSRSS